MAVVKADAYGHGAVPVSKFLASCGVEWFGVATLEEAAALRDAGLKRNILVLGTFFPAQARAAVEINARITASSVPHLEALNRAGTPQKPVKVHLKFDTGMNRMGFSCEESEKLARRWAERRWKNLRLEGIFTHLSSAEQIEAPSNRAQEDLFLRVLTTFEDAGVEVPLRHVANSAGASFHSTLRWDMVRAGIALYGYEFRSRGIKPMGTAPALSLKTRVLHLKRVPRNSPLGYNGTYRMRRPGVIATLPIGYADGVNRRLSFANVKPYSRQNARPEPMCVLIRGRRAPLVGRVSMDLILADVTEIPDVHVGDEVVLLGRSGSQVMTAEDWASYLGTISYEILCALSPRVYRVYVQH